MQIPTNYSGKIPTGTIPEKGLWVTLEDGRPHCLYSPHPKQVEFHESNITNLLAIGSRGSGKSLMLRNDAHMRALSVPGCTLIMIRQTMKQLEQSHLLDIGKEMRLLGGYYHGTKHCAFYPNGSRLFFSYVGHAGDALNLLSAEFLTAYYDELSVIPWDYFQKLNASVRTSGTFKDMGLKGLVRGATNPLGASAAEVMKYFVNKDINYEEEEDYIPSEWGSIRIDMEDNPTLDIAEYKKRFAGMPEHIKAAWLRGEYMESNTLFDFRPTKYDEETGERYPYHVINELDIDELVKKAIIYRVYDHGWAPDPAYCAWIAHLGDRYIVFHEKMWHKTVVSDIAASMREEDAKLGIRRIATTYCDPTIDIHTGHDIRTIKDIFEQHGVAMECSVNNREQFASAIHTALQEQAGPRLPRLQIYRGQGKERPGAPYLIKAIPLQRFDDKKPLALANQAHDHPVVAVAYFLISHSSEEQRSFSQRVSPKWMRPKKSDSDRWILGNENIRNNH